MTDWIIQRKHVSAADLGIATPWVPEPLCVTAQNPIITNTGWLKFYGQDPGFESDLIFQIRADEVVSVRRADAQVREGAEITEFMTVSEVADKFGTSSAKVRRLIEQEKIHAYPLGSSYAIPAMQTFEALTS